MKKLAVILLMIISWTGSQCQGFWMEAVKFKYTVGEEVKLNFFTGESFEGELWDLKKNKIEKLDFHHLIKISDLKNLVKSSEKDKLKFKLDEAGTLLISAQSGESYSVLDAQKFNDYLKEKGLDDILEKRERTNSLDKQSKEYYTHYSKILIQSDSKTDDTYKKKTGQPLEIIPQQNPYNLKSGDYLQCLILFKGKPVPHQMVEVWNRIGNTSFLQNAYTENDGTVKFPISSKGPWMVSTVKMIESKKTGADWQSFGSSLTFGID